MYGAPWLKKASEEKNEPCSGVRLAAPVVKSSGPPAAKKTVGTMTATAPSIASTCAKSVSTEARKPDHRVYSSTPAPMARMPWLNVNGESIAMSAPPAIRFDVRLIRLPSTLEPASMSWLERPWRACMTSARVCARGATFRIRLPKG